MGTLTEKEDTEIGQRTREFLTQIDKERWPKRHQAKLDEATST